MIKRLKGYLEAIVAVQNIEDDAYAFQVINDKWEEYIQYLAFNVDRMPNDLKIFVDDFVLGKKRPKRFHDDIISNIKIVCRDVVNEDASVSLTIKSEKTADDHSAVTVNYFGVTDFSFPQNEAFYLISCHEILVDGELFQHIIHIVGSPPIVIVFKNLQVSTSCL